MSMQMQMMMGTKVAVVVGLLGGGASGLSRLARTSLRAPAPEKAAEWYKDQFGLETAVNGADADVIFAEDFRVRMLAEGTSEPYRADALSIYGVGVEMQRSAFERVCAASGAQAKDLKLYASMVPDEAPEKITRVSEAELADASGYRVYCSAAEDDTVTEPAPKIVLVVSDLDASVEFYTKVLGLRLLRRRALLPHQAAMSAYLGYDATASEAALVARPEGAGPNASPRIELRYLYSNERVDANVGACPCRLPRIEEVVVCCENPAVCAALAPGAGGNVTSASATVARLLDPDGYKIVVCDDLASLDA